MADNGSTDGSAAIAASYGATVLTVPQRGFGAACHAGLLAASSDVVCVMDADGSFDPADLLAVARPVLDGATDLMLGRRAPQDRSAWPLHARIGNAVLSAGTTSAKAGVPLRDLGPMRAFRREGMVGLGLVDRRFGYPLEMVLRAAGAGLADQGGTRGVLSASRQVEGHRHRRRHHPDRARHAPRAARRRAGSHHADARGRGPMSECGRRVGPGERWVGPGEPALPVTVIVIAKEPVPGRVKTRLTPPFSPPEAARLAQAALADTLDVVAAAPVARRVIALDGQPGPWLPPGFEVVQQRGNGLDERLAAAFSDAHAIGRLPMVLIGMDTPQVTPELLADAALPLASAEADACFGPAADGGYWLLGLQAPDWSLLHGVPMSRSDTGRVQLRRLMDAGLRVAMLPGHRHGPRRGRCTDRRAGPRLPLRPCLWGAVRSRGGQRALVRPRGRRP